MMLDTVGWMDEAAVVNAAVRAAVKEGKSTRDLGGPLGTREVGDWLAEYITKRGVARASAS
jgi:isocitrate/isopropylmalate dehydrogenase